jgi:thiamine biosynthesis lipoprotein ApbE
VAGSTQWRALGTSVVVAAADEATLAEACDAVVVEIGAIDQACSRFRDDSDLSRLNAVAGSPVAVSPLLASALRVALRAAHLSDGAVDPTVGRSMLAIGYDADFGAVAPDGPQLRAPFVRASGWRSIEVTGDPAVVTVPRGTILDLGATAKALCADRAAAAAHAATGAGVLVNLGGDISVAGEPPPGGWTVRVTDDHAAAEDVPAQLVTMHTGGVATSSSTVRRWRRGGADLHHIVDPRSGTPAESPYRTVSVAASTCVDANTAATAALVRGDAAVAWLESTGLPARLVTHDGVVLHLNGWPEGAERAA